MEHQDPTFPGTAMDLDPIDIVDVISLGDSTVTTMDDCNDDMMDIQSPDLDFVPRFGAGLVLPTFNFLAPNLPQASLGMNLSNVNWWEAPAPAPTPMDVDAELMDMDSDTDQALFPQGNQNPFKFEGVGRPTAKPEPIFGLLSMPINWSLPSQGNGYTYQNGSVSAGIAGGKKWERTSAAAGPNNIVRDVDWTIRPSPGLCPRCKKWKRSQRPSRRGFRGFKR